MIIHTRIESSHLAGNLLGDPSERDLFVYLPPGYEDSDHRYPTAYLLHAYGSTAEELVTPPTDKARWAPPIEDVLDPVFGRMGVPPMIVAIPDGWSRWGCGQWVDSPTTGNFEQYVLHDVIPYVDGAYRASGCPKPRRVRVLVGRVRLLEPRVAQPGCLRRHGRALGRLLARHDAQLRRRQPQGDSDRRARCDCECHPGSGRGREHSRALQLLRQAPTPVGRACLER